MSPQTPTTPHSPNVSDAPQGSGELRPVEQSLADIERELNERLTALGLPVSSFGSNTPAARQTQLIAPIVGQGANQTQVLDLRELRNVLHQQIRIAEIKEQVIGVIHEWLQCMFRTDGLADPFEFEVRAASLLIPYCREYIPDFPESVHPAELAMDLDFQKILSGQMVRDTRHLTEEQIDDAAVQVIQALLNHPMLPKQEADRIEVSLHTTTLKDQNGTSVYTPSDGRYLKFLIEEQQLLNRDGEVGLLAMLISGRKWNKIDSDLLFSAAIEYTLEALAKKRGIEQIVIRNQGPDHPSAYILREYILHHISDSLERQIMFVEDLLDVTKNVLALDNEEFTQAVRRDYLPRLKHIFEDLVHDSIYRFLQVFDREYLESKRSPRSKMFLLKRAGDFCELAFYAFEAVRNLESPTGEVYARERLYEGTEHFARRNNIPVSEGMDFFNRKNTLAELMLSALKYRRGHQVNSATGGLKLADGDARREALKQLSGILMSDLLYSFDQLRRTFDHDYARGRDSSYNHYLNWKTTILAWSESYARLLFGRSLTDVDRYRIESLAAQKIEENLAFVNMHLPSVFRQSGELGLESAPRTRQPEDIIKENFLCYFRSLHTGLIGSDQLERDQKAAGYETHRVTPKPSTTLSQEDLQKRVFLARSDLPLATYTLEVLASFLSPETHDRAVLLQALDTGLDLAQKAFISEETRAVGQFLKQLLQRLDLLVVLTATERSSFRDRIALAVKELQAREPIELSSYLFVLKELDEVRLSDERILEEWKNVETSLRRLLQISVVLVLTRKREQIQDLVEKFAKWLTLYPPSKESPRRRTYDQRLREIRRLTRRGRIRHRILLVFLKAARYTQVIASVRNWQPPDTYILDDLLALETQPRRIRELEAVLAVYPRENLDVLIHKYHTTLWERFQETPTTPAYYSPEERQILAGRLERLQVLQRRSDLQCLRARWGRAVISRLVKPFQKVLTAEE